MARGGVCLFCGCTYDRPCPNGCGWANRAQTFCTECIVVRDAWVRLRGPAPLRRAFFRGFVAGADDERATESNNPYAAAPFREARENPRRHYWQLGYARGGAQKGGPAITRHRGPRPFPAAAAR